MAYTKTKTANENAEKKEDKGKMPDYVVRARQTPGSDFFITCGAAWYCEVNGKKALSLKLTSIPVQTDGSFLMLEPRDE